MSIERQSKYRLSFQSMHFKIPKCSTLERKLEKAISSNKTGTASKCKKKNHMCAFTFFPLKVTILVMGFVFTGSHFL